MPDLSGGVTEDLFTRSVIEGESYRASRRKTLSDGEELIVHIDPVSAGGTVYLEPPRVNPEERANYNVFENADPGTSTTSELFVHNMRYDGQESPEATVTDVSSGGLDTSGADQTEETLIDQDNSEISTGGAGTRGVYRIVPTTDTISIVVTDQSGGNNNDYGIDITIHEGDVFPD